MRLAPTEGAYQGQLGDVLRRLGRGAEATTAFRRAAALLDAVPTPTAFQKTWRRSVAEALGDSATLARLRKLEPTGPVNVQYDEDKLLAQSAALARRA